MTRSTGRLFDLALPAGLILILSTVPLLLFPGLITVACQFLAGLVLVGIFASRTLLRYARERRGRRMNDPVTGKRTVERGDLLVLIGFAALYAGFSGSLMRYGWARSGALLFLLLALLLRPRVADWFKARTTTSAPLSSEMSLVSSESLEFKIVNQERIQ